MVLINFDGWDPAEIRPQLSSASEPYQIAFWEFLDEFYNSSDVFISNTSGSTGEPKQYAIRKDHALCSANASISYFGIQSSHTLLLGMDIKYIGAKMMILRAIQAKAKLVIVKPNVSILDQVDWDQIKKIDFVSMSPNQVFALLEKRSDVSFNVSKILIGGGVISPVLCQMIQRCTSVSFYESFGMTETISHFAIKPLDGISTSFSVLDGFSISKDEHECLTVFHPNILPEKVVTRDVIQLIDDQHFVWKGRKDFIINSGGVKIYPEAVEQEISKTIDGNFALIGVPDDKLGECLAMVYEDALDEIYLIQEIKKTVSSPYFVPKKYLKVDRLDYTENGKIKRAPLKELFK